MNTTEKIIVWEEVSERIADGRNTGICIAYGVAKNGYGRMSPPEELVKYKPKGRKRYSGYWWSMTNRGRLARLRVIAKIITELKAQHLRENLGL